MTKFYLVLAVLVAGCGVWSRTQAQEEHIPILLPGTSGHRPVIPLLPPMEELPVFRTFNLPACVGANETQSDEPCIEDTEYSNVVSNHVKNLLRRDKMINAIVNDPILSNLLNDSPLVPTVARPTTRFGTPTSESPVCAAQEMLIYPKRAKTPKGDWLFVVNQDDVQQAIKVEMCISEGQSCNRVVGTITSCRQKYVYRRMLTVSTNKLQPEEVLMPSCCICYARQSDFDINSRARPTSSNPSVITATAAPLDARPPFQPPSSTFTHSRNNPIDRLDRPVAFPAHPHNNRREVSYEWYPYSGHIHI